MIRAIWKYKTYTVTFKDGDEELSTDEVSYGEKATRPAVDPTKTGYTFDDWYTDSTYATKFDFENTVITADTAVYAKFTEDVAEIPEPVNYTIIEGADAKWTKGSEDGVLFVSDADFDKLVSVKVDDAEIDAANYEAESGSTRVTLKAAYLETLSDGAHKLAIVSNDGEVTTQFTVLAANNGDSTDPQTGDDDQTNAGDDDQTNAGDNDPANTGDNDQTNTGDDNAPEVGNTDEPENGDNNAPEVGNADTPKTGDAGYTALLITIAAVALIGMIGAAVFGRKRRAHK